MITTSQETIRSFLRVQKPRLSSQVPPRYLLFLLKHISLHLGNPSIKMKNFLRRIFRFLLIRLGIYRHEKIFRKYTSLRIDSWEAHHKDGSVYFHSDGTHRIDYIKSCPFLEKIDSMGFIEGFQYVYKSHKKMKLGETSMFGIPKIIVFLKNGRKIIFEFP